MQVGQIFSLNEIISIKGVEITQAFLESQFRCDRNVDIERFLFRNAIHFELGRLARTYLILDDDAHILAYFTLSFKSIKVKTSKNKLKKLTAGLTNSQQINVFLIGQIGKNSLIQPNVINLKDILDEIYPIIENGQMMFGGRVTILECENNEKLISYYEKHGFQLLETENDAELKTMYIIPDFE